MTYVPDRMSVFDLAELAADVGPNPRTIGVLLELDGPPPGLDDVRSAIRARLGLAPRLAQRMRRVPLGAGRPVWEDVVPDLNHHVRARSGRAADLLEVATAILSEPLDSAHPWWTLTVVDLADEQRSALVWSSHHALADGPSVLRLLATLVTEGTGLPLSSPTPMAGWGKLATEALASRARSAFVGVASFPRQLVGMREFAASSYRRVPTSVLNQPVTAGYTVDVVDVDLAGLRMGAHECGATINDALLWAWGAALHNQLATDGHSGVPVVISCTVTAPSSAVENRVGAVRFNVPKPGLSVADDLSTLAAYTRRHKRLITGSTWWLTSQLFRGIAALGMYRWFVERQHSITSLLTNMRGPSEPFRVLGRTVQRAVPLPTLVGNVTVLAAALSCGGRLVVTIMCAPQAADIADELAADFTAGLASVSALAGAKR